MVQVQAADSLHEWRESAEYWNKHRSIIHSMFAPLTRALIEDARIKAGDFVLDVAGGAGEPSLTIAGSVGPTGVVTCTVAVPSPPAMMFCRSPRCGPAGFCVPC